MPIADFSSKFSSSDINKVNSKNNPNEFDSDFGPSSGGSSFGSDFGNDSGGFGGGVELSNMDALFDESDSFGGGSSNNSFGGFDSLGSDFGKPADPFGGGGDSWGAPRRPQQSASPWGTPSSTFPSPFGAPQSAPQQPAKKDLMDKAMDAGIDSAKSAWVILKDTTKSIKNRNYDDLGYFSRNLILTGIVLAISSLILGIIGSILGISFISLGFGGLPLSTMLSGILTIGTGLITIGISAIAISNADIRDDLPIDSLPDVGIGAPDNATQDYEDSLGDTLDSLFSDSDFDLDEPDDDDQSGFTSAGFESLDIPVEEATEPEVVPIDLDKALDTIPENQVLTRETLVKTFVPFLPQNKPEFSDLREIAPGTDEFLNLQTVVLKVVANILNCDIEDTPTDLESVEDGFFSYKLKIKRLNALNSDTKKDLLAREFENYMREGPEDDSVHATVQTDGDFFVVTVSKGITAIVTLGDVLSKYENYEYFLDEGHKMPLVVGIDQLGKVILDDAKKFDTMMIIGKPRSGKSWYVLNVLMSLMMFNSPDDCQFVIIDPKRSHLFNTLSLMPHVIGLFNDDNILNIMDDIISNEGERRKTLLSNNKVDDIWGLRKKGINIPLLYLVIDEVITVKSNLKNKSKDAANDFDRKMQVLMSELPYVGIRLIFVPHRATGIIDKTNRTMLQFISAVKSDPDEIVEALGVKGWNRSLTEQGDMAIKTSTRRDAFFARGPAISTSDEKNAEIIKQAAKAYYKMGFPESDLKLTLSTAYNRNEADIRNELDCHSLMQYNANKMLDDSDILDKDDLLDEINI